MTSQFHNVRSNVTEWQHVRGSVRTRWKHRQFAISQTKRELAERETCAVDFILQLPALSDNTWPHYRWVTIIHQPQPPTLTARPPEHVPSYKAKLIFTVNTTTIPLWHFLNSVNGGQILFVCGKFVWRKSKQSRISISLTKLLYAGLEIYPGVFPLCHTTVLDYNWIFRFS